jgi:anti-sigma B factor antagonist
MANRVAYCAIISVASTMRTGPVPLQIDQRTDDGAVILSVTGRLMLGPEGAHFEDVVRQLVKAGTRMIVIDFAGVTHIDSTGIGRCIAALNAVMQAGGKLHMVAHPGPVRDAFRVTQLDRVFRFFEDVPAAQRALAA